MIRGDQVLAACHLDTRNVIDRLLGHTRQDRRRRHGPA